MYHAVTDPYSAPGNKINDTLDITYTVTFNLGPSLLCRQPT